jgi:hypothetical protein
MWVHLSICKLSDLAMIMMAMIMNDPLIHQLHGLSRRMLDFLGCILMPGGDWCASESLSTCNGSFNEECCLCLNLNISCIFLHSLCYFVAGLFLVEHHTNIFYFSV